jgi:hypothetical protein
MGNSATCLGPRLEVMATFPSFSTISEPFDLQSQIFDVQSKLTNYVSLPASFVPGAGPFLAFILTFLGTTDFSDISGAFAKAQIHESILQNDIHHYNAEITVIKNSLSRLNQSDLTPAQLQPEIITALRRSEYLFELFKNPNTLLYRYPLVSMPYFIRVINILWATIQISNKLDPTLKYPNDITLRQLPILIRSYVSHFFEARLKGITYYNCGFTVFSSQCLVYDRPWLKTPGRSQNYSLRAYQFRLPLNQQEWRDGIVIRTPNGCKPEERDYPNLESYTDYKDYKDKIKGQYENYFIKVFPVSWKT